MQKRASQRKATFCEMTGGCPTLEIPVLASYFHVGEMWFDVVGHMLADNQLGCVNHGHSRSDIHVLFSDIIQDIRNSNLAGKPFCNSSTAGAVTFAVLQQVHEEIGHEVDLPSGFV